MVGSIVVEATTGSNAAQWCYYGLQQNGPELDTMANYAVADQERMRRFRDAALPHLDDIYTLARYLMRNSSDADDAVQECYLRASNCACGLTKPTDAWTTAGLPP
jgi:hypothetical protein